MGDQMRQVVFTRFSQMYFVACPSRLTFFAIAGFLIIGGIDKLFCSRNIVIPSPVDVLILPEVILNPDATQDLYRGDLTQERGSRKARRYRRASSSHLAQ
jgi:hypothetical protein